MWHRTARPTLAGLLCEAEPEAVLKLCRHLKLSNDLRKQTCWLAGHRAKLLAEIPMSVGRLKKWLAEPWFEPLVLLARCARRAKGESLSPLGALRRQIRELGEQAVRPERLLDGHELIRMGAVPGPMVGRLVEELYMAQLENHVHTAEEAKAWVRAWLEKHSASRE